MLELGSASSSLPLPNQSPPTMRLVGCLLVALLAVQASQAFVEQFGEDWAERWTHSADPKYGGKFKLASPVKGLKDKALKVGGRSSMIGGR